MDSSRIKQVNELIRNKLSFILRDMFCDEIISVTQVKTSPDLSFCKVFVSILEGSKVKLENINKHSTEIRSVLASKIQIRHIPNIKFYIDDTEAYAEKMDKLFKNM